MVAETALAKLDLRSYYEYWQKERRASETSEYWMAAGDTVEIEDTDDDATAVVDSKDEIETPLLLPPEVRLGRYSRRGRQHLSRTRVRTRNLLCRCRLC